MPPGRAAGFYRDLLGLEQFWESPDFVALKGAGIYLTMQRIEDHQPATWPAGSRPKQLHLELAVTRSRRSGGVGARSGGGQADIQPSPDGWRVFLDPAGHPFCFTTLVPEL